MTVVPLNVNGRAVKVTADPDTPGRSYYAVIKSNLAPKPDPLAYRIDAVSGRIAWENARSYASSDASMRPRASATRAWAEYAT